MTVPFSKRLCLKLLTPLPALRDRLCQRWNINTADYWNGAYNQPDSAEKWSDPKRMTFYQWVAEHLPPATARILDVGSGLGYGGQYLQQKNPHWQVEGLDFSREACDNAVIPSHCVDITHEAIPGPFDYIIAVQTLEHVPAPLTVLEKLLKQANKAVILTIPYQSDTSPIHPNRFSEASFSRYANVTISLRRRQKDNGLETTDMLALIPTNNRATT